MSKYILQASWGGEEEDKNILITPKCQNFLSLTNTLITIFFHFHIACQKWL